MGGDCEVPDMQSVVFGGSGGTKQKTGARYEGRMRNARHLATGPWWEVWKKNAIPIEDQQRNVAQFAFPIHILHLFWVKLRFLSTVPTKDQ